MRGEEKRQVEGREGKRENGGAVIDARKREKKIEVRCNFSLSVTLFGVCVCVVGKQDKKMGALFLSHTAVSSGLRTK